MTLTVTHAKVTSGTVNNDVEVDLSDWNADHTIEGLGSNVEAALAVAVGTAGSVVVNGGVLGTPSSGDATNLTNLTASQLSGTVPAAGLLSGPPLVIYADGQSNISLTKTYSWTPNANAKIWNNTQDAVNTGTAFTALSSSTIGIAEKFASDLADAFPTRRVYLIKNGYTGQAISHWLSGTGAPDMYANGTTNLVAALAAISVTKIDFYLRWQGEADQTPSINTSYIANFATMMSRYWANSYFPRQTPAIICGMCDSATSGSANADTMNLMIQAVVNADPGTRRLVNTADLSGATYWDATNPGHMTGAGYYAAGAMAASAILNGPGRNTLPKVLADAASGNIVLGNPGKGSAFQSINLNGSGIVLPTTGAASDVLQADGTASFAMQTAFGAPAGYVGRASGNTFASPSTLSADTLISFFGAQGHDGTAWTSLNVGNYKIYASENWTSSAHGTYSVISNTKTGTTTQVDCLRVDPGFITIYGTTSGSVKIAVPAVAGTSTFTVPTGTTDLSAAWTAYTPTVTSSISTFTTVSATGRYKQIGKTVFVEANVTITTAGTAAGGLQVSLPLTAAAFEYVGNAIEIAATAKSGAARIPASGTTMNAFDASGTTFIASGHQVTLSAVYEIP